MLKEVELETCVSFIAAADLPPPDTIHYTTQRTALAGQLFLKIHKLLPIKNFIIPMQTLEMRIRVRDAIKIQQYLC